jgi:hypothetical protein
LIFGLFGYENKFTYSIQIGDFGVCFGFARKSKDIKAAVQLNLEDFGEVREHFQPCAVDTEKTHTFTTAIHYEGISKK